MTDDASALLDRAEELALLRGVSEQRIRIAVTVPRVVPGAELDRLDPEGRHPVEHLLERDIGEEDGEEPELPGASLPHRARPSPLAARPAADPRGHLHLEAGGRHGGFAHDGTLER